MAELDRVDIHPTHSFGDFKLRSGRPLPFGASRVPGGVNFSIFSSYATSCTLVLFNRHEPEPLRGSLERAVAARLHAWTRSTGEAE